MEKETQLKGDRMQDIENIIKDINDNNQNKVDIKKYATNYQFQGQSFKIKLYK